MTAKARYRPLAVTLLGVMVMPWVLKAARPHMRVLVEAFQEAPRRRIDELEFLLTRAVGDRLVKKPSWARIKEGVVAGRDFKSIWRMGKMSRQDLAVALREAYYVSAISRLPAGTPTIDALDPPPAVQPQLPLFSQ